MVVNEISKLRGQREKIKEFELHKSSLVELEAECKKVKAVIEEMDGELAQEGRPRSLLFQEGLCK